MLVMTVMASPLSTHAAVMRRMVVATVRAGDEVVVSFNGLGQARLLMQS